MQLPCIIGSCLNTSVNLAGWVQLGDLVTGANKHYQGWLQYREKSWIFKTTFWIQILVWLKSNNRAENWRKTELWCWKLFSTLKLCLLTKALTNFTPHSLQAPYPCPYSIQLWTKDKDKSQNEKKCKAEGQKFKEGRENQSQKWQWERMFRFQNLKAPS